MLTTHDLKTWLHQKGFSQLDKLLLVLSTFDGPRPIRDIKDRARDGGLKITESWNPSSSLSKSNGLAINTREGWELTDAGRNHVRKLGVETLRPAALNVANDLRAELAKIVDSNTRAFVEEAIRCYEAGLHRSAVVMSWIAAVDLLHKHIVNSCLPAFNAEASRVDTKWKAAKTSDDIGRMGEAEFLDRLAAISVLSKNVKTELKNCLDRRNGCGHPNSLKLGTNTVAHHIEVLLLNIFKKF